MRNCGILMPVFSLPSPYGIGDFGQEAYEFVDFLEKAGQSLWQILPLNPTNYGDSPYQSFSTFAGNPYFISPKKLIEEKLLTEAEVSGFDFGSDSTVVDYGKLYENRLKMLEIAFDRFVPDEAYETFVSDNSAWLEEFALFMALKNAHQDKAWIDWEEEGLRLHEAAAVENAREKYARRIDFYKFLQFKFSQQWHQLKAYANEKGIRIVGDIPIYVAYDSADVWGNSKIFWLDEEKQPVCVAGCPPDAFSDDGQLWGNPLYLWKDMAAQKKPYDWWIRRIAYCLDLYDIVRIDHFRGFEAYYSIPFGDENAKRGEWMDGPGMDLFDKIRENLGEDLPIIAEDLGFLTPGVYELLAKTGFPGMKVLQFAFDPNGDNEYLPHNLVKHSIVYTGTHDNDTIMGWTKSADPSEVAYARKYLHATDSESFNWTMMRAALSSVCDTCILMMQDLLGLGSDARINTPSTAWGNWRWRILPGCTNDWLAGIVKEVTETYRRLPKKAAAGPVETESPDEENKQ
ncbi:MAG: 4-alpha-glucanotransferase [Firmicutes bacterium]|nr:4-alpha-glucanotransferase [Bacillota bacterium]